MYMPGDRRGYTLIEVLMVMGIMGLIAAGAMAIMLSSVACFDNTSAETFTGADAVLAMQMITSDVREAKDFKILANGRRLRVIPPERLYPEWASNLGYYDCHKADMVNQIDYYTSDETGVPGHSGTWLWKGKNNGNRQVLLKKNVTDIFFEQDENCYGSVKITITTRNDASGGPKQTQLTNRVVYLRNYRNN